jgi:putative ABC transport system permease protein
MPGSTAERHTILPKTLVLDDAEAIAAQVPAIERVAPQINSRELIVHRNKKIYAQVVGTTPEFLSVRRFEVARGRFLTDLDLKRNDRVVAIGPDLAEKLFGDRDPLNQHIRIKGTSFQTIGTMQAKGTFMGANQDDLAFIPITTMANRLVGRTSLYGIELTFISTSAKDAASIEAAKFQMTNLLRLRHKITGEDDFIVNTQKDVLRIVGNVMGALTILLGAIAAISLVVGGIGIMNIMLVSVKERTQEIGLRKAVGASQPDILTQFLIEAIVLSSIGGFLGTLLGIGGTLLVGVLTPLKTSVSLAAIALAVSVAGSVGLVFGVVPAQQAARLDPIDALRSV